MALSSDRIRILVCSFSFPYFAGNVFDGKFVFAEAAAYARNGAEVTVLTPHFPGAPFIEFVENVRIIRFPYFLPFRLQICKKPGQPIYGSKNPLHYIQFALLCLVFSLRILFAAHHIDVIHAQWTLPALLSLPAKWLLRKKLVLTARGSDLRLLPASLNRFIHRQVDAAIDCFGPQPWNLQYKANFPARFLSLPLIVHHQTAPHCPDDIKALLADRANPLVVLYVGRFDRLKITANRLPIIELINSAMALRQRNCGDFHIIYIGDGDIEIKAQMREEISKLHVEDRVTILGARMNVIEYMQHCHLGLGGIAFNGVSQEYTICGIPQLLVKGSDNCDTPWDDMRNAIFFDPDVQGSLTEILEWAIINRDKLATIGNNAKTEMNIYITDSQIGGSRYLEAFRSLVDSPTAS